MKRLFTVVTLLVLVMAIEAKAQALFGSQSVRIIYPFAAGSAGDTISRLFAEKLQATINQTVVVENRTGASGKIGIKAVKAAAPDGNTLLVTPNGGMTLIPLHDVNAGYDPEADFSPISQLVLFDFVIAVANTVPAKNLNELQKWVQANPMKGSYGSPGAGSTLHFVGMKFGMETKLDLQAVQYRGNTPVVADLISGQLPMGALALADTLEQHKSGSIRILGVSSHTRSIFLPEMPTFLEQGFNVLASGSYSLYAPAKTPTAVIDRLQAIAAETVQAPDVKKRLLSMGFVPTGTSQGALIKAQREEIEYWKPLVQQSGFKSQD